MQKIIKVLGVLLLLLLLYVLYIFTSTGYFRKIENKFTGEVLKIVELTGVEDMQVSYTDDFILLSSDDRAAHRDGKDVQGHLYYIDLTDPSLEPVQLTTDIAKPFHPHGISMIEMKPQVYRLLVINHVDDNHTVEVFNLYNDSLEHLQTLSHPYMVHPNDVVALDDKRFYFTNDHGYIEGLGKLAEDYLGLAASNVIYYDGENYKEVVKNIAYANGINYDHKRDLLYVASPRDFLLKVYKTVSDGTLQFLENIDCQTGIDNVELDQNGKLWIGSHPSLLAFAAYAKGSKPHSPSEVISIDYRAKGDYTIDQIFVDDGRQISASSVAVPYNDFLFVGNVMDDHFLILNMN